ncbi:MAG: hypothetical protein ABJN75_16270 [Hoeflea sp.]|uniref:hypothetical protein n=1 Tax=Hoeflea sp. TaxID=1940281 RepID=UPI00329811BD
MQTALILMTILGCDDTATQCHYIEMLDQRWATIQQCDASSEDKLQLYSNIDYPVVVAVCQTPEDTGLAEVDGEPANGEEIATETAAGSAQGPAMPVPKVDIPEPESPALAALQPEAGIASRVLNRFRQALPETETVKVLVSKPVHVVTDSYSWMAKRFDD